MQPFHIEGLVSGIINYIGLKEPSEKTTSKILNTSTEWFNKVSKHERSRYLLSTDLGHDIKNFIDKLVKVRYRVRDRDNDVETLN